MLKNAPRTHRQLHAVLGGFVPTESFGLKIGELQNTSVDFTENEFCNSPFARAS
jgi:hypothetical protein